jgi:O-antigen ligase
LGLYVRQFLTLNEFYFYNFIWGFGFKASSGTLGLPFYTNFHNIYYEMFFSGGFFHLFLFIVLLLRTIFLNFKVFHKTKIIKVKTFSKFIIFSVLYFMINMLIGASTIYHPIGGSLVIVLIFFSRSNYRNITSSLLN